jgi:hypothetical protein
MTQEVITNLTADVANAATSANTASVTPIVNQVMFVTISSNVSSGTPNVPAPSLSGWTFHQVATQTYGPFSSSVTRITKFIAIGSGNGAINITFGGQTQQRIGWVVDQISNTKVSGVGGADAIVQTVPLAQHSNGFNVSMAAFANINNGTYVVTSKDAVNFVSPTAPLAIVVDREVSGSPNLGICSMFYPGNITNPIGAFGGSGGDDIGTIATEIAFQSLIGGFIV